ncbi:MAG TPA: TatD family hydrolase [Candidatus Nanoarchaeia archaeon]|nr:TatD family hydrolase [Candidatus Nanoarchaeia archaeon]
MLIDCHAHLDDIQFSKDLDEVIKRAEENKIIYIINNGVNPNSNRKTLELSKKYKIVKPALGFHPTDSEKFSDDMVDNEIEFIKKNKNKIFAIGEVGLDYHWEHNEKRQKNIFLKFITLSEKTKLPLIIHSRKAEKDIMNLLESSRIKNAILHCFEGNKILIKKANEKNFKLSIPPSAVRSDHFKSVIENISLQNILTETDSPYLSAIKNERNEPLQVKHTIKLISEIKKITVEEIEKIIFMNFKNFFKK